MGRTRALMVLVAAGALVAGCTGGAGGEPRWRSASSSPPPQPEATSAAAVPAAELTLAFAGDVHFTGRTLALLDRPETAFGRIGSTLADRAGARMLTRC